MRGGAGLILLLLPASTAAQEQSRDALLTALAMNECAVTEEETPRVFGAQGFDGEFVRHELGRMVLDGTAFLEGGRVLRVRAESCPPTEPVATPAQELRLAIEAQGCSIEERDALSLIAEPSRLRPVVASWMEQGIATVESRRLTLKDCE